MGYSYDGSWFIDWLACQQNVGECVMQRFYNWLIVVFLCFLTVNFYNSRNDLSEGTHSRYRDNCALSEKMQSFRSSDARMQQRLIALELAANRTVPYSYLQDISVKVVVDGGSGSGVLFCREVAGEWKTFVWTAGHVAKNLQRADKTFKNAAIKFQRRYCGTILKEWEREAKVIACGNQYTGEDLALLEIVGKYNSISSVEFSDNEVEIVGTEVIHVGSTAGFYNSMSLGIVSQTDREFRGKSYDQTSTMAYPGSSGGGVYTTDGKCIGLVTLGVGPGLNFYVPVRRMRAWAKKEGIEWAIDASVPVPLSRTPTELEMTPREAEVIISLPPPPLVY